jgi:metallo-beta-lactamase family protein
MKIKFLGASGQVTGSSYLITGNNGQQLLLDMGMFQGSTQVHELNYAPLQFKPENLLAVLLTHAHLDHCGRLPLLTKNGYKGDIYMTQPTKEITEISLFDTAHINEEDEVMPLFTKEDVENVINLFKTVNYDQKFNIGSFEVIYKDAGHIIGSASIEIIDNSSGEPLSITFSGDLGNTPEDLIKPTEYISNSNIAVIETTYGDRIHPKEDVDSLLTNEVNSIEKNDGTLLIPSFSIERSQEIVHRLGHLKRIGKIRKETQIFFDSPMGEKVTQVFEENKSYLNPEITQDINSFDPFHFPGISYTRNSHESKSISEIKGAKVIIAGSGMMSGGRILNHAITFLPMSSTRLLFVGYQAEHTIGRRILEGDRDINIEKVNINIKATVSEIHSLSSHADQPRLLKWLKSINGLNQLFLTHGDEAVRQIFAEKVKNELNLLNIYIPNLNDEIEVN